MFEDVDFPGNDVSSVSVKSALTCHRLCKNSSLQCSHWSWISEDVKDVVEKHHNSCWLKNKTTTPNPRKLQVASRIGVVSGVVNAESNLLANVTRFLKGRA